MSGSDVVNVTGERESEGREEEIPVQTALETVEGGVLDVQSSGSCAPRAPLIRKTLPESRPEDVRVSVCHLS